MAEARAEDKWSHTSAVLAMIANANRDSKKKTTPYKPADFNPMVGTTNASKGIPVDADNIEALKVFVPPDELKRLQADTDRPRKEGAP